LTGPSTFSKAVGLAFTSSMLFSYVHFLLALLNVRE
jgi:hypothetical protein